MKLVKIFFVLLLFLSFKVNADDLISHLNKFFKQEYSIDTNNLIIAIRTPFKKNKICKKPHFLLSNNFYHFGFFDVLYTCGKEHKHLKVELQVKGKYIIANKKIFRGTKIRESDLKSVIGRLDKLPNGTYLHKKDVINRVNLRDILAFQPITSFMTRVFWVIKLNQEVTVKLKGIIFEIITIGKALENGGLNEKIRVQIKNGKVITGIVNKDGEVIVIL